MPDVSLTTFMDFVSKSGSAKLTVVRQWKNKPEYHPARDFYKLVRDTIVEMHRSGGVPGMLAGLLDGLGNQNRLAHYPSVIDGYSRWLSRRRHEWFGPPNASWAHGDLAVTVNPELGLVISDVPHIIKLYFKAEPLSRQNAAVIMGLMGLACRDQVGDDHMVGVLDVRNARLYTRGVGIDTDTALLRGEAAYWLTVWPEV